MTSPGSRWQLLLMADDGRIVPFRRIKGLMISFVVLFVLLGLACAGLGWWLVSETVRHEETKNKLLVAQHQADQCLVDLESRKLPPVEPEVGPEAPTEKADPSMESVLSEPYETADSAQPVPTPSVAEDRHIPPEKIRQESTPMDENTSPTEETVTETPQKTPSGIETADSAQPVPLPSVAEDHRIQSEKTRQEPTPMDENTGPIDDAVMDAPEKRPSGIETADTNPPDDPVIALGDKLKVSFSEQDNVLTASFRIRNTGPRSTPVQGRCVVVFKPDESGPDQWVTLPDVTLVNGEPSGKQGNRFKISRYIDMTIKSVGAKSLSNLSTATVYVYDHSGEKITEKIYPIEHPSLYLSSKKAYDTGNYEEARKGFQKLVETYPKSDHADNSQFWIGETYFNEKLYEKAILEYQKVIENYPSGNKVPAALLKQGMAFLNVGETNKASHIFKDVVTRYPGTSESKVSQQKLKSLKLNQ